MGGGEHPTLRSPANTPAACRPWVKRPQLSPREAQLLSQGFPCDKLYSLQTSRAGARADLEQVHTGWLGVPAHVVPDPRGQHRLQGGGQWGLGENSGLQALGSEPDSTLSASGPPVRWGYHTQLRGCRRTVTDRMSPGTWDTAGAQEKESRGTHHTRALIGAGAVA